MMKDTICVAVGLVGGFFTAIFGGWDSALVTLVVFMAIDFFTGIITAMMKKSKHTESGGCSLPRKTQKTDTQNEKNAPEHHVQERFLLPINGVSPLFYPFNFSSILATCCKCYLKLSQDTYPVTNFPTGVLPQFAAVVVMRYRPNLQGTPS